LGKT